MRPVNEQCLAEQIRSEVEAVVNEPRLVICDRGVPDIISHTIVLDLQDPQEQELARDMVAIGKSWSRTYDLVLWSLLDEDRSIESDEIRKPNKDYQRELEAAIAQAFTLLDLAPMKLPRSLDARLAYAASMIHKMIGR